MKRYYDEISDNIFNCKNCPTRCDGISKGKYNFSDDVNFSEIYENYIIDLINRKDLYIASKCEKEGYPDIEIRNKKDNSIKSFLEIKVQRRTFMSVEKYLPKSNLKPSETLALNLSDILRYFKIGKEINIPISIMWVLLNRPCIVEDGMTAFYHQTIEELSEIYLKEGNKRRFRRKSGEGDIVDGLHKGVVVNYHFSINELKRWYY